MLADDRQELRKAHTLLARDLAKTQNFESDAEFAELVGNFNDFSRVFLECAARVDEWEGESFSAASPSTVIPDTLREQARHEAMELLHRLAVKHRFTVCEYTALAYMYALASDIGDKHGLRGHLPTLVRLEGRLARMSEGFLRHLRAEMKF